MRLQCQQLKRSAFCSTFGIAICVFCLGTYVAVAQEEPASDILDDELLQQISLLSEVMARIQQDYLDTPDAKTLMYGAIRGMLRSLDPYSQFFEPESYAEFRSDSQGAYGGLGMEIGIRDNRLTVISPIKGTPADNTGIQSGVNRRNGDIVILFTPILATGKRPTAQCHDRNSYICLAKLAIFQFARPL